MLHEKLKKKNLAFFTTLFHQTEIIKTESACFFMFVNKRKMPENCDFDENEAAEFIDNAGISKNTKYCKEKNQSHFMDYVKSNIKYYVLLSQARCNIQ